MGKIERTGEKRIMNCGLEAQIVAYRKWDDVDIRFEDGYLCLHKRYDKFKSGRIVHPKHNPIRGSSERKKQIKEEIEGSCFVSRDGIKATVIEYNGCEDITIMLPDNSLLKHRTLSSLKKGRFIPMEIAGKILRVGERRQSNTGMMMEIIAYRNSRDIDVVFEDGTKIEHAKYQSFKTGQLCPKQKPKCIKEYLGKTILAANGMQMKVVKAQSIYDIDVEFEDGAIVSTTLSAFKKGYVKHPEKGCLEIQRKMYSEQRKGETSIASNGMKITLLEYRSNKDVDVQFEDGYIKKHIQYNAFLEGRVFHPSNRRWNHTGESNIARNGLKMTVIKSYPESKRVDIQFEDGIIVEKKAYQCFRKGEIKHPGINPRVQKRKNERLGMKRKMNCGMIAEIIEYITSEDITISFEDGTIAHATYGQFKNNSCCHPSFKRGGTAEFLGYHILSKSFSLNSGKVFYKAISPSKRYGIWTPQQMMATANDAEKSKK